jgi:hypothetical protein
LRIFSPCKKDRSGLPEGFNDQGCGHDRCAAKPDSRRHCESIGSLANVMSSLSSR